MDANPKEYISKIDKLNGVVCTIDILGVLVNCHKRNLDCTGH